MNPLTLRIVAAVFALAPIFAAPVSSAEPTAAAHRPNVLLIMADDLGYSDLGCYGSEIETPNLDRLAQNGLRFTQFYNTARCWPTRAALLTGYYAQQVRRDVIPGEPRVVVGHRPAWAPLLPALLKTAGYRTYHSGKWHLDGESLPNGFDHSYRLEDQDRFFSPQKHFDDDRPLPPVERGTGYYATVAIADHAIECLKQHSAEHNQEPFFQYVAFTCPHFPIQALPEDIARYQSRYRSGWETVRKERFERMLQSSIAIGDMSAVERNIGPPYKSEKAVELIGPGEFNRPRPWNELNAAQVDLQSTKMAIHAAMIDRMDREIGRLLDQVRQMGAWDNTVIFFLSDNGASAELMVRGDGHDRSAPPGSAASFLCLGPGWSTVSNTPFRRHKTWVYEGGISTPLIVHWPAGIATRGELRRNPGHVIDITPTILDLTGVSASQANDSSPAAPPRPGKSLMPVFSRDDSVPHDYLWWLHEGNRALRAGNWKLVADKDAAWELYDLSADRVESHNLALENPDKVRELESEWNRLTEEFRKQATSSE
jgi:arylsulfatase